MSRLFGPGLAVGVILVGGLATWRARTGDDVAAALRALGTLLTVVTGLFSALWWHRSADLADDDGGGGRRRPLSQADANLLSAAAATCTGLALIGGVFGGLAWNTPEGAMAGAAFLLLLAMSGGELRRAAMVSFRQGPRPRSVLAAVVLVLAFVFYAARWLVR